MSVFKRLALVIALPLMLALLGACGSNSDATLTIDTTPTGKYVQGTVSGDVKDLPEDHTVWTLVLFLNDKQYHKVSNGPLEFDANGHFSIPDPQVDTSSVSTGSRIEFFEANGEQTQRLNALPLIFPITALPAGLHKLTGIIAY